MVPMKVTGWLQVLWTDVQEAHSSDSWAGLSENADRQDVDDAIDADLQEAGLSAAFLSSSAIRPGSFRCSAVAHTTNGAVTAMVTA